MVPGLESRSDSDPCSKPLSWTDPRGLKLRPCSMPIPIPQSDPTRGPFASKSLTFLSQRMSSVYKLTSDCFLSEDNRVKGIQQAHRQNMSLMMSFRSIRAFREGLAIYSLLLSSPWAATEDAFCLRSHDMGGRDGVSCPSSRGNLRFSIPFGMTDKLPSFHVTKASAD